MLLTAFNFVAGSDDVSCTIYQQKPMLYRTLDDNIWHCQIHFDAVSISKTGVKFSNARDERVTKLDVVTVAGIEYLPEDISQTFPNLNTSAFIYTSLKSISKKNFHGLYQMDLMQLQNNLLSSIAVDTFDDMTNLRLLFLNNNKLKWLPANLFSKLSNLNTLYLHNNQITYLNVNVFRNNRQLISLGLSGNQLTALQLGVFDSLTNLKYMSLASNPISSLHPDLFRNCKDLDMDSFLSM